MERLETTERKRLSMAFRDRRLRFRSLALLLPAAVGLILLAGFSACRKESAASAHRPGKTTLAVIPMGTTHEFWKAIHAGALAAARELDVEIIWKGPLKEDDRNEQIQIVETLSNAGIDALVLTPMDDRALVRPVAEAKRAGIPTVIFNSALQGSDYVAYISTDNYKGGVLAARRVGELLKGKGQAILIRVIASVEGSTKREQGFLDTIKAEFPGIVLLSDNQYAGITTETAYQTVENLVNRFPEVEAIFTPNESTTFGCNRALEDHGLAGKVFHVGFDSSKKLIEALAAREIQGLVLQDPVRMGYLSVVTAVDHLRGRPYEKSVDTGVFLATPENMSDPAIRRLLSPDLSILER
jgi:ribose transport system substrate-binding protein